MTQQFINDVYLFFNPYGTVLPQLTGAVTYNGATQTGGGTDVSTYSMTANEVLSTILISIFNEFRVGYLRQTADEATVAEIEVDLGEILAQIAALASSNIAYDGGAQSKYATGANINNAFTGINGKFITVDAAIAAITTGVTQAVLNTTLSKFVVDFCTGLTNTSNTLLVATFAAGTGSVGGQYFSYAGGTIAVTASQDNYIYISNAGVLSYLHVNNGAGQPATPANTEIIAKLVTDGTGITTYTDKRNLYPFITSQISGLYAANSIPFASRITSEWAKYLVPATSSTGRVLISNGTQFVEDDTVTVDTTNNRVGINQSSPTTTLDLGAGNLKLGDDGTSVAGSIKYIGGTVQRYDGSSWKTLATKVSELSNVTITSQATNDVLYANSSTTFVNAPNGTVPVGVTATGAVTYIVQPTDVFISVDVTANAVDIHIPNAATAQKRPLYVSCTNGDITTHSLTITSLGGNIKGGASLVLSTVAINTVILIPDGTNWMCIKG